MRIPEDPCYCILVLYYYIWVTIYGLLYMVVLYLQYTGVTVIFLKFLNKIFLDQLGFDLATPRFKGGRSSRYTKVSAAGLGLKV